MNAVPPVEASCESAEECASAPTKTSTINIYPVIGILLAILAAVLTYGGLLLALVDDWSFLGVGNTSEAE